MNVNSANFLGFQGGTQKTESNPPGNLQSLCKSTFFAVNFPQGSSQTRSDKPIPASGFRLVDCNIQPVKKISFQFDLESTVTLIQGAIKNKNLTDLGTALFRIKREEELNRLKNEIKTLEQDIEVLLNAKAEEEGLDPEFFRAILVGEFLQREIALNLISEFEGPVGLSIWVRGNPPEEEIQAFGETICNFPPWAFEEIRKASQGEDSDLRFFFIPDSQWKSFISLRHHMEPDFVPSAYLVDTAIHAKGAFVTSRPLGTHGEIWYRSGHLGDQKVTFARYLWPFAINKREDLTFRRGAKNPNEVANEFQDFANGFERDLFMHRLEMVQSILDGIELDYIEPPDLNNPPEELEIKDPKTREFFSLVKRRQDTLRRGNPWEGPEKIALDAFLEDLVYNPTNPPKDRKPRFVSSDAILSDPLPSQFYPLDPVRAIGREDFTNFAASALAYFTGNPHFLRLVDSELYNLIRNQGMFGNPIP